MMLPPMPPTPTEQQVQAVRRRLVQQQVQLLRRGRWLAMDPDVLADCVLAARGDVVIAHRLMTCWEQLQGSMRTPDMTAAEEVQLVAYVRNAVSGGYECDCGTCGGGMHSSRFMHPAVGKP